MQKSDVFKLALQYQEALAAYAYSILREWSLAEDAVQETLILLLAKWEEYNPEQNIFFWLKKMVYFKSLELLRARLKTKEYGNTSLEEMIQISFDENMDESHAINHKKKLSALENCMMKLSDENKHLLIQFYWQKISCDKIAQQISKTVNAVWLMLSRVRKTLKKCIENQLELKK